MPNLVTPNMLLTEPTIGGALSPIWAQLLNANFGIIDQHNHTPGSGVQIPPGGLDINSDLTFQGNNLLALNSAVFNGAVSSTPADLSIYSDGTDFYFKDINGNPIQLTKNGQPNSSAGNIQGLPSTPIGSAGISWINAQSTFQFNKDDGTAGANLECGSIIIRYPGSYPTPSGNFILLEAPNTLATGYSMVLPPALPGAQALLSIDNSGIMADVAPDNSTVEINSNNLRVKAGGITATQLQTNVNIPGSDPTIGGRSAVAASAAYGYNLQIVRTGFNSAGSVNTGEGSSVTLHPSSGVYRVTFDVPFASAPTVVACVEDPSSGNANEYIIKVSDITTTKVDIFILNLGPGTGVDYAFDVIAIGQRTP